MPAAPRLLSLLVLCCSLGACLSEPETRPWSGSAMQGMNVVCWSRGCFDSPAAARTFQRARALGLSHIALVPTWYVPDATSGAPAEHAQKSPSLEELERAVQRLHAIGLGVLLKPHVDRLDGGSRTEIRPTDSSTWWEHYRHYVLALAALAARAHVEALVVGTELTRLSSDAAPWHALVDDVRNEYSGELSYAANWDELEGLAFLDGLDWIGVDGYFPGCTTEGPTVLDYLEAWQVHLARLRTLDVVREKGLVLTELGAPSRDAASQARVYKAALYALREEGGLFFWNLWDGDSGGTYVATEDALAEVSLAWP